MSDQSALPKEFTSLAPGGKGVVVWRVKQFQPEKVPAKQLGQFYSGDSYLVLNRYKDKSTKQDIVNIHYWQGEDASQDEVGTVAILAVQLDTALGGKGTQFQEVQGSESPEFLKSFKNIRYKKGGYDSGFKDVEVDGGVASANVKHLYQVTEHSKVSRVIEVELKASSLNSGDSFVLDSVEVVYIWHGADSSIQEKARSLEVAARVANEDHPGQAPDVVPIHQGDATSDDAKAFFAALGVDDPASVSIQKPASKATVFSAPTLQAVSSSNIAKGEVTEVSYKSLKPEKVFRLETGSKIFLWIGREVDLKEREAIAKACGKAKSSKPIAVVKQGLEPIDFKEAFGNWISEAHRAAMLKNRGVEEEAAEGNDIIGTDMEAEASKLMAEHKEEEAGGKMTWDERTEVKQWRIEKMELVEVEKEKVGEFYQGDSFVVLATLKVSDKAPPIQAIYFWQGASSSKDERIASAILTSHLDSELQGAATQVRVVQGKEPSHFFQLFNGKIIVHSGGVASGFKNVRDADTVDQDGKYLYHIKQVGPGKTYIIQVEESATSLNSGDAFVLITASKVYTWVGKHAAPEEQKTVADVAADVLNGKTVPDTVNLTEGSEPEDFWALLGGKQAYPSHSATAASVPPRMFLVTDVLAAGSGVSVEYIPQYTQADLEPSDVIILDTHAEVFVWLGSQASATEQEQAPELAKKFVEQSAAADKRDPDTPVTVVHQFKEPPMFTMHFLQWVEQDPADLTDPYEEKLKSIRSNKGAQGEVDESKPDKADVIASLQGGANGPLPSYIQAQTQQAQAEEQYQPQGTGDGVTQFEAKFVIGQDFIEYEQLQTMTVADGLDMTQKEEYLSDEQFQTVLGMSKEDFRALPKWKKLAIKKDKNLF